MRRPGRDSRHGLSAHPGLMDAARLLPTDASPASGSEKRRDSREVRMIESLRKVLSEISDSLLDPIKSWVLARSWPIRLLFLGLTAMAAYGCWSPAAAGQAAREVVFLWRASSGGNSSIPVSGAAIESLRTGTARLSESVESDLVSLRSPLLTPWSASQAAVPLMLLNGRIPDREGYVRFVQSQRRNDCFCWAERPDRAGEDVCMFIGGWVMAAFAELGVPLSEEEMGYVTRNQHSGGWWPMFPDSARSGYASTYATAWMVLGLVRQREKNLVPPRLAPTIDSAIRRGAAWLLRSRSPGARWRMHPEVPETPQSESVSGFILYVLHEADVQGIEDVDREWLASLPLDNLEPHSVESPYFELRAPDGISIDHFSQVRLPWIMLATVKAYPSGSLIQRARALAWLDRVLTNPSVRAADTRGLNWVRAEVLLGLVYVLRELQA